MMRPEAAETLGLNALAFLAAAPEDFQRFLDLSGLDAASIRGRASEPAFLAAVLDFLLAQESLLTAFCDRVALEPREVHLAVRALGGPVAD
jgi:hypothetical protein